MSITYGMLIGYGQILITEKILNEHHVDAEFCAWFVSHFPDGGDYQDVLNKAAEQDVLNKAAETGRSRHDRSILSLVAWKIKDVKEIIYQKDLQNAWKENE